MACGRREMSGAEEEEEEEEGGYMRVWLLAWLLPPLSSQNGRMTLLPLASCATGDPAEGNGRSEMASREKGR